MVDVDVVAVAREIATRAHAGQVDKAGEPYIEHVERVAARLTDPGDIAVALLHDVIEDTEYSVIDLMNEGIPPDLREDVVRLTHVTNEPRIDYYARVRTSPRALRVKLADIADNSDPERLALLDDATRERLTVKYTAARAALED